MTLRTIACSAALALALGTPALADGPTYDDPGMHFQAPDGWTKLDLPSPSADADSDAPTPVAAFVFDQGRFEQRTITITVKEYSDTLDAFKGEQTSQLRSSSDSAFISQQDKTTLSNGMPAYFIDARLTSQSGADTYRAEYLVIDTKRAIDVAYTSQEDFSVKDAKAALASLYVVVYPGRLPD